MVRKANRKKPAKMIKTNWMLAVLLLGAATLPSNATSVYTYTFQASDTHLGTRGCKAEVLADFLAHNEC